MSPKKWHNLNLGKKIMIKPTEERSLDLQNQETITMKQRVMGSETH